MITKYQFLPVISKFSQSKNIQRWVYSHSTLIRQLVAYKNIWNVSLVSHSITVQMFHDVRQFWGYHKPGEWHQEKKMSVHFQPLTVIHINTFESVNSEFYAFNDWRLAFISSPANKLWELILSLWFINILWCHLRAKLLSILIVTYRNLLFWRVG